MKKLILITIILFGFGICSQIHGQKIDSILSSKINSIEKRLEGVNRSIELNNAKNESLNEIAGSIISWSGIVFTIFSVLIVGAGIYTGVQITEIRKMRSELEKVLSETKDNLIKQRSEMTLIVSETKNSIIKQQSEIEKIKNTFEHEQKKSMKLIFPLIEGQINYYQGDYVKALSAFLEAKKIDPEHPVIVRHLYRILTNIGRPHEAIQQLEQLLDKKPNDKVVKYRLAQSYRRNNQLDYAEKIIKDVAEINKYPPALYEYGTILMLKENYIDAESNLMEANKLFLKEEGSYKHWVFINLSVVQMKLGKMADSKINAEKAIEITTKLLKTAPNNPQYLANHALAKFILNENIQSVLNMFERAISFSLPIEIARSEMEKLIIINSKDPKNKAFEIIEALKTYVESNKIY